MKTIQQRGQDFAKKHAPKNLNITIESSRAILSLTPEQVIRDYMAMAYVNAWYNGRAALRKELRKGKR